MRETIKASRQGRFDCLCGVYTLVNTVNQLRGPLTEPELQEVFDNLINQISSNWNLENALLEGISGFHLSTLFKRELANQFQLVFKKPFHKKSNTKVDVVWREAKLWIDSQGVIITSDGEHWSLIYRLTAFRAYLRDSIGIHYISRKELCTTDKKEERIYPSRLFFVKRMEDMP